MITFNFIIQMKSIQKSKIKQITKQQKKALDLIKLKAKAKKLQQFKKVIQWAQKIAINPHYYRLEESFNNHHQYYRITLMMLNNIDILQTKRKQFIQYSCILYSMSKQTYIGNTFASEMFQIQSYDRGSLHFNKSIYLYTQFEDLLLKVDVWRMECQKNAKGQESMARRLFIGSFSINLGKQSQTGVFQQHLNSNQSEKFFSQQKDKFQSDQQGENIKKKSGVQYQIISSHSLSYFHHFIPENCIVDEYSDILGLKTKFGSTGQLIVDERYKLRIAVTEVNIPYQAIKNITDVVQQNIASKYSIIGKLKTSIKEFRMHLCFHNGYKNVSHQSFVLKNSQKQQDTIDKKGSLHPVSNNKIQKNSKFVKSSKDIPKANHISQNFIMDAIKELKAVFLGPNGVLILWIEGKFESKLDYIVEQQKKSKNETVNMALGFSIISLRNIVDENILQNVIFSVGNPFYLKQLCSYLSEQKNKIQKEGEEDIFIDKFYCKFESILKKSEGSIDNIQSIEKDMNQIETLKTQKERLARIKRKIKEQKRKKLIQLNQEIPFLDTIQLKQQLYQAKINSIKNQKQQKEDILFYLKSKITNIERSKLAYQQKDSQLNQSDEQGFPIKIQLNPNFVDYQPHQIQQQSIDSNLILDYFSQHWIAMQQPAKTVSDKMVLSIVGQQTYLSFKIMSFNRFYRQSQQFILFGQESSGDRKELLIKEAQCQRKEIIIKIFQSNDSQKDIKRVLNSYLNGFFPIYLYPHNNPRFTACSLLDLKLFINKSDHQHLFNQSKNIQAIFKINQTIIANFQFNVAFTRTLIQNHHYQPNISNQCQDIKHNSINQIIDYALNPNQNTILNRINRFKKQRGILDNRLQIVNKGLNTIKRQVIRVKCSGLKNEQVFLRIKNNDKKIKRLKAYVVGDRGLQKVKVKRLVIKGLDIQLNNNTFQMNAQQQGYLILSYDGVDVSFNNHNPLNAQSKIQKRFQTVTYNINITESDSQIITHSYQLQLHTCQQSVIKQAWQIPQNIKNIIIPINAKAITTIHSNPQNIIKGTNKLTLNLPQLKNNEKLIWNFTMKKGNELMQVQFCKMQLQFCGCQKMVVEGRLWQKKDILIKIPIQIILEQQSHLQFLIENIKIYSRSIHLKVKKMDGYGYSTQMSINRKNNQIYIRAQLGIQDIGNHVYGVQICDKNNTSFYMIGITTNIPYPFINPYQIITLKTPSDNLDQLQPFLFKNKSEKGQQFTFRTYRPDLLQVRQGRTFLKSGEEWRLEMILKWSTIRGLASEQLKQINILIGLLGTLSIEYMIIRCKLD